MTSPTRIRAAVKEGVTEVRVLMAHVMESGQRKGPSGDLIPAYFITEVVARHNDRLVLDAQFGPSVSANPYLAFRFKGGVKGDKVSVSWTDNRGESRSDEVEIV